jgi:two-component system chemotaxis response regulator CheB
VSAGGVSAIIDLARGLPRDLPAAVLLVIHVPADYPSVLPRVISRKGGMPAKHALDGEGICRGQITLRPPIATWL